jgi:hypothetical protein
LLLPQVVNDRDWANSYTQPGDFIFLARTVVWIIYVGMNVFFI